MTGGGWHVVGSVSCNALPIIEAPVTPIGEIPLDLARVWWTHNTRPQGGRATHLVRVYEEHRTDVTLCGIYLGDRLANTGPNLTASDPEPLTDCANCARSRDLAYWRERHRPKATP